MRYNYKGIKPESIELLCLNRFNDSKEFYEEHKEELKQGITVPLRQMVLDMSELLFEIADKMYPCMDVGLFSALCFRHHTGIFDAVNSS